VFKSHPEILNYPVIVIECTFLFDHVQQAVQSDHSHWSQLEPYVQSHPNTTFILIHFSLRYKSDEIEKFFDSLPNGRPKNVIPWT